VDATGTPGDGPPDGQSDDGAGQGPGAIANVRASPLSLGTGAAAKEGAQAGAAADAHHRASGRGGAQGLGPGGVAGDAVSYATGYGYGPGYGDPGDSGYGYGYGPGHGDPGDSGYGYLAPPARHEAAVLADRAGEQAVPAPFGDSATGQSRPLPVVGPTPALRGLPGGPGIEPIADETRPAAPAARSPQATGSVWQQAQSRWSDSGIVWQRAVADWEPAEAEWERIQAAWKPPGKQRGSSGMPLRPARSGPARSGPATSGPARRSRARRQAARRGSAGRGAGVGQSGRTGSRRIGGRFLVIAVTVILVLALLAYAGYLVSGARGGGKQAAEARPPVTGSPNPPAALAAAGFATSPSLAARGVFQSLNAVASYGMTVVAGAEAGTGIARTQFFFFADAGHTRQRAPVFAPDGGKGVTTSVLTISSRLGLRAGSRSGLTRRGPARPAGRGGYPQASACQY
jgi:hypothetical protein